MNPELQPEANLSTLPAEASLTKAELNKFLAKNFNTTDRSVKGNINVLDVYSKEDKERYTAHLFKEKVKEFYQTLI